MKRGNGKGTTEKKRKGRGKYRVKGKERKCEKESVRRNKKKLRE